MRQNVRGFPSSTPETKDCDCDRNESRSFDFLDEVEHENLSLPTLADPPIVSLYRILVPVLLFACLLSFFSNSLIVCSARWIRRRRLSPNLFLSLSLAAADAFASLVVGVGLVLNSLLPITLGVELDERYSCLLLVVEALRLGSLVSTAMHLLALAANHHVGIAKPLHYGHIVTRRMTTASAAAIWCCPQAFFFAYFSSMSGQGFRSPRCSELWFLAYGRFRATVGVLFFIPLAAMLLLYGHIYAIVRRHQPQSNTSSDRLFRRKLKATVTTLFILAAYVLGWMPAVLYFVLTCLDCPLPFLSIPMQVRVPVGFFTNAMVVARCLADPALYLVRMPEVRDALRTMVGMSAASGTSSCHSSQNTRRMTLLTSQKKGLANGRGIDRNQRML